MKMRLMITIGIIGLAVPTFADVNSGADLLKNCASVVKQADGGNLSEEESLGAVYCAGYLAGFSDSHVMETTAKPKKPIYCLPTDGVKNDQMARILTAYFKKHPERLQESARLHVVSVLISTFPCKKSGGV